MSGPARGDMTLAPVLAALSDPVRLQIVCMLATGPERTCRSFGLPIAKSTLTHHLKVLREAGVIIQRPVGTSRMTCLRKKDLDARQAKKSRPLAARQKVKSRAAQAAAVWGTAGCKGSS